jgi:hypothetical protein
MKTPAELAAWLLFDALETAAGHDENEPLVGGNSGETGLLGEAHDALLNGASGKATDLLRQAVELAAAPAATPITDRGRTDCQHEAQHQRDRLAHIAQIALCLIEQPAASLPLLADELGALTDLAAELSTTEELVALLGSTETLSADLETLCDLDSYRPAGADLGEKGGQA